MSKINDYYTGPQRFLDPTVSALNTEGFAITAGSFLRLVSRGQGPAFELIKVGGRTRAIYDIRAAIAWAKARDLTKIGEAPRRRARAA